MTNIRFTKYILVLIALCGHILFGQHDISSPLVLCFGEDGHIALETTLHESHNAVLVSKQAQDNVHCVGSPMEENCQDIAISFSHDELYDAQKYPGCVSENVKNCSTIQPYYIQYTKLAQAPPIQTARPPNTQDSQTLKNTILLI